jgi:hypothetical protein
MLFILALKVNALWEKLGNVYRHVECCHKKYWVYEDGGLVIQIDGKNVRSKYACVDVATKAAENAFLHGKDKLNCCIVDE